MSDMHICPGCGMEYADDVLMKLRAELASTADSLEQEQTWRKEHEAERDRLLELLREANVYLKNTGWGKPGVDLPSRIDAALGGEGKDECA